MSKPITILDVALASGVEEVDGTISAGEFARVGLSILGGCQTCGATLGAYNGYPSTSGFWQCAEDIGDSGFSTVEEFVAFDEAPE